VCVGVFVVNCAWCVFFVCVGVCLCVREDVGVCVRFVMRGCVCVLCVCVCGCCEGRCLCVVSV
jgi:hypothetical protein